MRVLIIFSVYVLIIQNSKTYNTHCDVSRLERFMQVVRARVIFGLKIINRNNTTTENRPNAH